MQLIKERNATVMVRRLATAILTLTLPVLTLIGTAIILFVLDWRLALATCSVIPLMAVATAVFRTRSARAYAEVRERLGLVTATLAEDIAGMRVVQAFTREQPAFDNFRAPMFHHAQARADAWPQTTAFLAQHFPV